MIANTFFSQNLKEGNIGEAIAAEFLTSVGFSVDDVSSNPDYFYKDIDLIATIDEETITVEVKADAKVSSTGNVCIEVIGNKAKNKKGWIYYCQARKLRFRPLIYQITRKPQKIILRHLFLKVMKFLVLLKALEKDKEPQQMI